MRRGGDHPDYAHDEMPPIDVVTELLREVAHVHRRHGDDDQLALAQIGELVGRSRSLRGSAARRP